MTWRSPSSFGRRRRLGLARKACRAHQPLDPMQTAFDAVCQKVSLDAPCAVGPVVGKEACLDLLAYRLFGIWRWAIGSARHESPTGIRPLLRIAMPPARWSGASR